MVAVMADPVMWQAEPLWRTTHVNVEVWFSEKNNYVENKIKLQNEKACLLEKHFDFFL